jgi:large subunit ribosomal protein L10
MSKYVKDLIVHDLKRRLDGVENCVIANLIGLDSAQTVKLRKQLREKKIHVLVVKNSLAARATEGSALSSGFEGLNGSSAVVWGAEDFVSLVKEITELDGKDEYKAFQTRGGVMDGEALTPARVKEISTWPSRAEQLSILAGQLTAPWRTLQSQLSGPGGQLASQIKKKSEE